MLVSVYQIDLILVCVFPDRRNRHIGFRFPIKQYIIRHLFKLFPVFHRIGFRHGRLRFVFRFFRMCLAPRRFLLWLLRFLLCFRLSGHAFILFRLDRHFLVCQERNILGFQAVFPVGHALLLVLVQVKPFDNALHVAALQFRIGEFFQILVPYAHPFTLP